MHQNDMGRRHGLGHNNASGTRPLLSNHLRANTVDIQLEVLKRKREVLKREQQKLSLICEMNRKRQYEHTNRNVSNTFGNNWPASSPKRANAPHHPWIDIAHNSFRPNMANSMPAHYVPSLLGHTINPPLLPSPLKPIVHPLLNNTIAQRHVRPMNVRTGFRNTQGIKKRRKNRPNKLKSYPVQERRNLVSKTTESQLTTTTNDESPEDPNSMILYEDRVPNNQLTGRLELAMGSIVKDICYKFDDENFQRLIANLVHRRTMKQVVRERIRAVMLNKPVGSVVDIVKKYREQFPLHTDRDIVDLLLNSAGPSFVHDTKTESPEEFFKKNITTLLTNKVQEMSSNLLKMYKDIGLKKSFNYTKSAEGYKDPNKAGKGEPISNKEATLKILRGLTGKYVTTEETDILYKYYTELIEDILKHKLPEYMPLCKKQFLEIFDMDQRFKTIASMTIKRVNHEERKKETSTLGPTPVPESTLPEDKRNPEISDQQETQEMETDHGNGMEEEVVTKEKESEEGTANDNNEMEKEVDSKNNESEKTANENTEIDNNMIIVSDNESVENSDNVHNNDTVTDAVTEENNVLKETLIENIPSKEVIAEADKAKEISEAMPLAIDSQESSSIPKSLSTSSEKQTSEAKINPAELIVKETVPAETMTPTTPRVIKTELSSPPKTAVTVSSPLLKELPYNVKLIGRPTLPNRADICNFLNKYRPTSIKKHKSINNLLVVGFINQEDYSRIIQANETVIGDITIIIKASEKVNAGKGNESINDSKKDNSENVAKEPKEEDKAEQDAAEANDVICKEATDSGNFDKSDEGSDLIGKEIDDQITNLLSTIKAADEDTNNSNTPSPLETISETEDTKAAETVESDQALKVPIKANVKESGRSTPVRSSRLGNVTPSTIRTRRSSRLMQE